MADYPDGAQLVSVAVTVNNVPVPVTPSVETAVGIVNRYTGVDTGYQVLCQWTVTAARTGQLAEVSMTVDNFDKAVWSLTVGAEVIMLGDIIQNALTLPFADVSLSAGTDVILSVKSSDGTAIVADGSISGKEIG